MEAVDQQSIFVIVSHDFGELAYAYDFIYTLQEKYTICIALPDHIYQSNRGVLPFSCVRYSCSLQKTGAGLCFVVLRISISTEQGFYPTFDGQIYC